LLNGNISPICLYNMVKVHPLTAEIRWRVWGTPGNFNGFCILASLLQRRCSTEVNQTLHDVWPSPALVYYLCILGAVAPNGILPAVKFTLHLALYYIGSVTAGHSSTGISQSLRPGTRKGITELSQTAPPWRSAITLGIGPHSS